MKETTFKEKFHMPFEPFIADDTSAGEIEVQKRDLPLSFVQESNLEKTFSKLSFKNIARGISYLVSSLFLGNFALANVAVIWFAVSNGSLVISKAISFIIVTLVISLIVAVLNLFGINSRIKEVKNYLIPFSISATGTIIGLVILVLSSLDPALEEIFFIGKDFSFLYFLPIYLIVGILTKNWVDSSDSRNLD